MYAAFVDSVPIMIAAEQGMVEIDGAEWHALPEGFSESTDGVRLTDGAVEIIPLTEAKSDEYARHLLVRDYLSPGTSDLDVLTQDFSLLPLRKRSPTYVRGRKVSAAYTSDSGELVVRKTFIDIDGPSYSPSGLMVDFAWFRGDGSVGLRKSQIVKEFTAAESETVRRQRRERQIDYLVAGAKGTPIAPLFDHVTKGFAGQIVEYKSSGSSVLRDAVASESGTPLAGILDTVIGMTPMGPYRIRDAIAQELSE